MDDIEKEILDVTGLDATIWAKSRKKDATVAVELGEKRRMTSVVPSNLITNWEAQFRVLAVQAQKARVKAARRSN
jgi:hypothetical protein